MTNISTAGPTLKSRPSSTRMAFQHRNHVTVILSSRLLAKTTSPLPPSLARLLPTQATGSTLLGLSLISRNGATLEVSQFHSHQPATSSLLPFAAILVYPATMPPPLTLRFPRPLLLHPPASPMPFTTLGLTPISRLSWTRTESRSPKVPRRTSSSPLPASTLLSSLVTMSAPLPPPLMVPPLPRLATSMLRLPKMLP